jgi:hypothetical protein
VSVVEMIETADEVVDAVSTSTAVSTLGPLEKIRAGLATLAAEPRTFDVATTAGDKAARQFRARCVALRTSIDDAYEAVNRPMLESQRKARELRDQIKADVKAIEDPVNSDIVAQEAIKTVEKARREQLERERVMGHQHSIEEIRMAAHEATGKTTADIRAITLRVEALDAGEGFEEFRPLAARAKAETLGKLASLLSAAEAHEAEAARLARERAELARLRTEQDERDKSERHRIEAAQKLQAEQLAAERAAFEKLQADARAEQQRRDDAAATERRAADAQAAAERAEADRSAKALRDAEEARQRRERAEQQAKLDAERAELRRQQDEADRVAREARLAEEQRQAEERAATARAKQEREEADARAQAAVEAAEQRGRDAWRDLASAVENLLKITPDEHQFATDGQAALRAAGWAS